ncbi:MAG TPA: metallophosphoesterase, partial [Candidatus Lokiarchaeia archaeon]|nr:metallophosphoesterase [Candidatus Lokiarchaeia archaeon]
MAPKGTRPNYYVKHWQLLSLLGVVTVAVGTPILTWILIGDWYTWITNGTVFTILILGAGVLLFAILGWSLFCVVRLIYTRGIGRYRFFKISSVAFIIAAITVAGMFHGDYPLSTNKPLVAMVGANPSTQVVIACYTATPQTNMDLTYQLKGTTNSFTIPDSGNATEHRFFLVNLLPNSTYTYALGVNSTAGNMPVPSDLSQTQEFKTAPANTAGGFTFLEVSDIHSNMPPALATAMAAVPSDLIIEDGDSTDYGAMNAKWDAYFATTRPLYARSSDATTAPLLLPVIGNHETMWFGRQRYGDIFWGVGSTNASFPYYFRIDVGNVHFLVLDVEWSIDDFTPAQAAWLNQSLASINSQDPNAWKIVVEHVMIYSSGSYGSQQPLIDRLTPVFKQYGVQLVLTGHDHHFERLVEDNVTYIVQGTGGGPPDLRSPKPINGSMIYL